MARSAPDTQPWSTTTRLPYPPAHPALITVPSAAAYTGRAAADPEVDAGVQPVVVQDRVEPQPEAGRDRPRRRVDRAHPDDAGGGGPAVVWRRRGRRPGPGRQDGGELVLLGDHLVEAGAFSATLRALITASAAACSADQLGLLRPRRPAPAPRPPARDRDRRLGLRLELGDLGPDRGQLLAAGPQVGLLDGEPVDGPGLGLQRRPGQASRSVNCSGLSACRATDSPLSPGAPEATYVSRAISPSSARRCALGRLLRRQVALRPCPPRPRRRRVGRRLRRRAPAALASAGPGDRQPGPDVDQLGLRPLQGDGGLDELRDVPSSSSRSWAICWSRAFFRSVTESADALGHAPFRPPRPASRQADRHAADHGTASAARRMASSSSSQPCRGRRADPGCGPDDPAAPAAGAPCTPGRVDTE